MFNVQPNGFFSNCVERDLADKKRGDEVVKQAIFPHSGSQLLNLPPDLLASITKHLPELRHLFAMASTCRKAVDLMMRLLLADSAKLSAFLSHGFLWPHKAALVQRFLEKCGPEPMPKYEWHLTLRTDWTGQDTLYEKSIERFPSLVSLDLRIVNFSLDTFFQKAKSLKVFRDSSGWDYKCYPKEPCPTLEEYEVIRQKHAPENLAVTFPNLKVVNFLGINADALDAIRRIQNPRIESVDLLEVSSLRFPDGNQPFIDLVEQQPNNAVAKVYLASSFVYGQERDFARAKKLVDQAIDSNPNLKRAYVLLKEIESEATKTREQYAQFMALPLLAKEFSEKLAGRFEDAKMAYKRVREEHVAQEGPSEQSQECQNLIKDSLESLFEQIVNLLGVDFAFNEMFKESQMLAVQSDMLAISNEALCIRDSIKLLARINLPQALAQKAVYLENISSLYEKMAPCMQAKMTALCERIQNDYETDKDLLADFANCPEKLNDTAQEMRSRFTQGSKIVQRFLTLLHSLLNDFDLSQTTVSLGLRKPSKLAELEKMQWSLTGSDSEQMLSDITSLSSDIKEIHLSLSTLDFHDAFTQLKGVRQVSKYLYRAVFDWACNKALVAEHDEFLRKATQISSTGIPAKISVQKYKESYHQHFQELSEHLQVNAT